MLETKYDRQASSVSNTECCENELMFRINVSVCIMHTYQRLLLHFLLKNCFVVQCNSRFSPPTPTTSRGDGNVPYTCSACKRAKKLINKLDRYCVSHFNALQANVENIFIKEVKKKYTKTKPTCYENGKNPIASVSRCD